MKPTVHPDVLLAIQDQVAALKLVMTGELDKQLTEYRKLRDDVNSKLDAVGGLDAARNAASKIVDDARAKAEGIIADTERRESELAAGNAKLRAAEVDLADRTEDLNEREVSFNSLEANQTAALAAAGKDLAARIASVASEQARLKLLATQLNDQVVAVSKKAEALRNAAAAV